MKSCSIKCRLRACFVFFFLFAKEALQGMTPTHLLWHRMGENDQSTQAPCLENDLSCQKKVFVSGRLSQTNIFLLSFCSKTPNGHLF